MNISFFYRRDNFTVRAKPSQILMFKTDCFVELGGPRNFFGIFYPEFAVRGVLERGH